MSKVRKGSRLEYEVKKKLEKEGFQVYKAPRILMKTPTAFRMIGGDIFDAFDIIATRQDLLIFAQVTSDFSHLKRKLKKIMKVQMPISPVLKICIFTKKNKRWTTYGVKKDKLEPLEGFSRKGGFEC